MPELPDYGDVEDLIYKGFLTSKMVIGETPVVLKSLNTRELEMVEYRYPSTSGTEWKPRACWLLAYSVFTFGGQNVLPDRQTYLPHLQKGFTGLPTYLLVRLLSCVNRLNETAAEKTRLVEPYTYGQPSRRQWSMLDGTRPSHPQNTSIPGTDNVGMNEHQKLWVYFNRFLDEEEEFEQNWNVGRFVASAFNAEGVKKASNKVESRREDIEEEREQIYQGKGDVTFDKDGRIEIVSQSDRELMEQIERSIEGQKDFHDKVIEAYENRDKQQKQQQRQQQRQARQERYEQFRQRDDLETSPYEEVDPEDIEEEASKLQRRRLDRLQEGPQARHQESRVAKNLREYGAFKDEDDPDHPMLRDDFDPEDHPS